MSSADSFGARSALGSGEAVYRLDSVADPSRLPYTVCVLLENLVRRAGTEHVTEDDVRALAGWPAPAEGAQLAFMPARVLMQDLTGVPAVVDLAALRAAVARRGATPPGSTRWCPSTSWSTTRCRSTRSATARLRAQHRARVRAQRRALRAPALGAGRVRQLPRRPAGDGHRPPGEPRVSGRVVTVRDGVAHARHAGRHRLAHHDDQRARRARLGRRRDRGRGGHARPADLHDLAAGRRRRASRARCASGVTATDLVLTMTERLRKHGVVGKFIEFFGPGLGSLTVADRATISNMSPEFGATASTFPVDGETLRYLRDTGRAGRARRPGRALHEGAGALPRRDASPSRPTPRRSTSTSPRSSRAWRGRAGRRIASRCPQVGASFADAFGAERRNGSRPGRRLGRDLGDHVVHEHLEPRADGGRRPASPGRPSSAASRRSRG